MPVRALVTTGSITLSRPPPSNVHLARFVPHQRVLPAAAAVVTHGGLGTVHAALAHGVPLVCLPIGRDQPDNAARVAWHRAGVSLPAGSAPSTIRAAVEAVLGEGGFRAAAGRLASAIADERAERRGPEALERVADRAPVASGERTDRPAPRPGPTAATSPPR